MSTQGRKVNQAGVDLICGFEKCRLKAYKPVPSDPWTIGWGETEGVNAGMEVTQAEADRRLVKRLDEFGAAVENMVKVDITDNQFAALVCLCYNIGSAALKFSTLMKYINARKFGLAAAEFDKWNKAGGLVLTGLVRRRAAERALFSS